MLKRSDNQVTPPGDQRPEHVWSAFTVGLNHALLDVTHCYGHFSVSHSPLFVCFLTQCLTTG
ncbi:hypothetical protein [Xenorhabdus thailandensis]|uniref:hypothetical protein n=1 Tax=Xenorhabdus thailandensis TaxID=3136255 RepID=UPI0030F4411A